MKKIAYSLILLALSTVTFVGCESKPATPPAKPSTDSTTSPAPATDATAPAAETPTPPATDAPADEAKS